MIYSMKALGIQTEHIEELCGKYSNNIHGAIFVPNVKLIRILKNEYPIR